MNFGIILILKIIQTWTHGSPQPPRICWLVIFRASFPWWWSRTTTKCFQPFTILIINFTSTGVYGRGPKAGAPASDAAGRGDAAGTPQIARPCRDGPRCATWQVLNRADAGRRGWSRRRFGGNRRRRGQNRADSVRIGRIGLYRPKRPSQAEKKKKRCKRTVLLT